MKNKTFKLNIKDPKEYIRVVIHEVIFPTVPDRIYVWDQESCERGFIYGCIPSDKRHIHEGFEIEYVSTGKKGNEYFIIEPDLKLENCTVQMYKLVRDYIT